VFDPQAGGGEEVRPRRVPSQGRQQNRRGFGGLLGDDNRQTVSPKQSKSGDDSRRSVTLSWGTPADDGGCKIGNYIVEYYRMGWNVWLKAATSRQLTTILGDLIEGSEYKFRVKAESPYGVSEPSEESDIVFIPDAKRA
jgi:hypothetical protein